MLRRSLVSILLTLFALPAFAQGNQLFRVEITNLTYGQIFAPPVVATHRPTTALFTPGAAASDELALLAEDGDANALAAALSASDDVLSVAVGGGVIMPGETVSFEISANGRNPLLSVAGMLVSTNDAFFAVDSFAILGGARRKTVDGSAWDAGSEVNNESCAFILGPPCGNGGVRDPDGAEGFVHVHRGIHGVDELEPSSLDWRGPVARITVTRMAG